MAAFEKFHYQTLSELQMDIRRLDLSIQTSQDTDILKRPVKIGQKSAPNAYCVLPMEGCDSNPDGSLSELTIRRYHRYAHGGAGLIWFEACAVVDEGRANPLQLCLKKETVPQMRKLLDEMDEIGVGANGYPSVKILQLTHSGRYSKPQGIPRPVILQHDPQLDAGVGIAAGDDSAIISDEGLEALVQQYVDTALLAKEAGFDGVDVKSCHRYLISEMLAGFTRPGKYGGSFENRTHILMDIVRGIRAACGNDFIVAARFSVFDALPYPYGFGVFEDRLEPNLEEPKKLAKLFVENGVDLLSSSMGNTYYKYPFLTRPMDRNTVGGIEPYEHPLESVNRLMGFTREIKKVIGNIPLIANGYTWLRQFIPYVGAATLLGGEADLIGLGRQSFAYPDFVRDSFAGALEPKKCCITCSCCTQIMRDGGTTGCAVLDKELYGPLYQKFRQLAVEKSKGIL